MCKNTIKNPKIIGLIFPLIGMVFIMFSKGFKMNHPIISFLIFYGSIPGYIFILWKSRKIEKMQPVKTKYNSDYNNSENIYNSVSHIEKKTTVTNTTITTETIYFRENDKYIESYE